MKTDAEAALDVAVIRWKTCCFRAANADAIFLVLVFIFSSSEKMPHAVSTGTTIVAVEYAGGVVIGADSRVSTGTYISNRASDKITPLSDNAFLLRSGSAADTQLVSDYVRHMVHQHESQLQRPIDVPTVANLVMQIGYNNKNALSAAAMLVAGYDAATRQGHVYAVPIGGTMVRQKYAIDGSGSIFIYGYMDSEYKDDMTREEAESFVAEAIALAMSTDGSSGGVVRLVTVNADGIFRRLHAGDKSVPRFGEEKDVHKDLTDKANAMQT